MGTKKVDRIRISRQDSKVQAATLVKGWVENALKDYRDPERQGVAKGDPIGFSRKKMIAAYWMTLEGPFTKSVEIAKVIKVSPDVLNVWRGKEDFIKEVFDACKKFSDWLIERLKTIMPDALQGEEKANDLVVVICDVLPFLHPAVYFPVLKFLIDQVNEKKMAPLAAIMLLGLKKASEVVDERSLAKWQRNPTNLEFTKKFYESAIDLLADPEFHKSRGSDGLLQFRDSLKGGISYTLDILASA